MLHRPIGVFDSGIGGLTIVKAMNAILPNEQICYFGDTAHLPYGDKSPELLRGYAAQITEFLLSQNVKAIVIACNTASAVAYDTVKAIAGDVPVFDVIQPAVRNALSLSPMKRIGVIGTKTTIQSHVYLRTILELAPDALVVEKATPLLVPMIEEGWVDNSISLEIVEAYMSDTGFAHLDSLILGCTHYPLIRNEIQNYFNASRSRPVEVVDSSLAVADAVKQSLLQLQLENPSTSPAQHVFYVSDLTPNFKTTAALFLGREVDLEVRKW
jgi:glutamate racemase